MHPVGQSWISDHPDAVEGGGSHACRACHGADHRGTVLAFNKVTAYLDTGFGSRYFWTGFQVGCYSCHSGPSSDEPNPNHPAIVSDASASSNGFAATIGLVATDADDDALTLCVVSQPVHGTAGPVGTTATYYPQAYNGADTFTYAPWDGDTDSNPGTVVGVRSDAVFADGFEGLRCEPVEALDSRLSALPCVDSSAGRPAKRSARRRLRCPSGRRRLRWILR